MQKCSSTNKGKIIVKIKLFSDSINVEIQKVDVAILCDYKELNTPTTKKNLTTIV